MPKTRAPAITALGLFALIVTAYLLMAWHWPVAYIWSTYEDLYGEWAQTGFFAVAFLLSARLGFMRSRYRWFFAILALACLYVVMEEISWGQRLIGFDTPELLKRHNLQREANIHNLFTGPVSTTTKAVIEYTMAAALFFYGLPYPLLLKFGWTWARRFERKGLAAPPLYLAPFFLTAACLELSPFSFNEAEVAEILVGISLAMMAAHYWFALRLRLNLHDTRHWPAGAAPGMALVLVAIVAVVGTFAVMTTRTLYADADKRSRIDARILNGYEKFAVRYAKYDRPDIAVQLLERVHQGEPQRTSVLRRIGRTYKQMGDDEQFQFYTRKAIDIGVQKYRERPHSRARNISLAYSYRQLGDIENFRFHATQAVDLATAKVKEKPDSASAAYWLARAYRVHGDSVAALAEYRRAYELKPGSSKYRRAYYSMRRKVSKGQSEDEEEAHATADAGEQDAPGLSPARPTD